MLMKAQQQRSFKHLISAGLFWASTSLAGAMFVLSAACVGNAGVRRDWAGRLYGLQHCQWTAPDWAGRHGQPAGRLFPVTAHCAGFIKRVGFSLFTRAGHALGGLPDDGPVGLHRLFASASPLLLQRPDPLGLENRFAGVTIALKDAFYQKQIRITAQ